MNTKLYKYIILFVLTFMAMPMMGQDYMNIFFKNGDSRKFYMKNITGITATKVDADGVEHDDYICQQITTIYDNYIYRLEDVDSITFTKIDEEKAEQNFVSAMPKVFSAIEDCETIKDVKNHLAEILQIEGVENAWSDGNQLYIKISESETFSFIFDQFADLSSDFNSFQIQRILSRAKETVKPKGAKMTAVVINQQHKDEDRRKKMSGCDDLVSAFRACGIEADYMDEPTVDFFYNNSTNPANKHFYDYDLIMLSAHGFYGRQLYYSTEDRFIEGLKCHSIITAEDIKDIKFKAKNQSEDTTDQPSEKKWKKYYDDFRDWRTEHSYDDISESHLTFGFVKEKRDNIWYWVGHPQLTEYFFRDVAKGTFKNPNTILFNDACESLKGDDGTSDRFAKILFGKGLGMYLGYTETNCTGFWAGVSFYLNMLAGMSVEQSHQSLKSWFKEETSATFKEGEIDKTPYGAQLLILPENKNKDVFLFPVHTVSVNQEDVVSQFNKDRSIEISATTSFVFVYDVTTLVPSGFKYGQNPNNLSEMVSSEKVVGMDDDNVQFSAKITNLEPDTEYYYQAYTYDGKYFNYGDICSFKTPAEIPSEAVDLGLPSGTLWAKWNMGATAPEEYGDYYAWGETEMKKGYGWYNYEHCDGTKETCHDIGAEISGTKYDVAHVKWGGDWQLPTADQINELVKNCKHKVTTSKGVKGTLVTGPNGNTIFLPCAGFMAGTTLYGPGKYGLYKSGTRCGSDMKESWLLNADADGFVRIGIWNSTGHSVRPVISGK